MHLPNVVLASLLLAAGCNRRPDDGFSERLRVAVRASAPSSAYVAGEPTRTAAPGRKEARWTVHAPMTWEDFAASLGPNLGPFRKTNAPENTLRFRQHLPGDAYTVEMRPTEAGPPVAVEVTFVAVPD